ncbi:MAG TPA: SDR family oxidoreductase [Terriglobia bacterium]|nr:SDR family oxidoreductase [Terriglobia bacterium]
MNATFMNTYLVTGGAGFIGSHVVHELVARGDRVRIIDDLSSGFKENLGDALASLEFVNADIREIDRIRPVFDGVDYVIHLAARSSVARSIEDPVTSTAVNIGGTVNVLVAARDARVKRVVFADSAAVYGDNPELPRVESQQPQPLSPYALTKLTGEYYCRIFNNVFGLEAVPLRFFNIFGPRQNPHSPYTGVLSKFIMAYLRGETPVIFGDGEQSRDFTYVGNVVDAVLAACTAPQAPGRAINVGVGASFTLNETVALLNRIFGREVVPRYAAERPGDVRHSRADVTLAKQVLGYHPRVTFEEGLRQTVEWYRSALVAQVAAP